MENGVHTTESGRVMFNKHTTDNSSVMFNKYMRMSDGHIYCEDVRICDLKSEVCAENTQQTTPFFVYSKNQILENIRQYRISLDRIGVPYILGYAMKANPNLEILKLVKSRQCSLTLVSGHELNLAIMAGFSTSKLVFNGVGKKAWELELAIQHDCLVNIDSEFGLRHTAHACSKLSLTARVILRINPDIDADVHPYVCTGMAGSKFGVDMEQVDALLDQIAAEPKLQLVGLHCHLGSTIDATRVFRDSTARMLEVFDATKAKGFSALHYLNIGGGLGIDYTQHAQRTQVRIKQEPRLDLDSLASFFSQAQKLFISEPESMGKFMNILQDYKYKRLSVRDVASEISMLFDGHPDLLSGFNAFLPDGHKIKVSMPTAADLIGSIDKMVRGRDICLILEPGRSIVGNAGLLITEVIGCKTNGNNNFLVVDGSMNEVMRPCLYGSYQHIELAEPSEAADPSPKVYEIVGPVCESGDFLGKERLLSTPHEGCTVAVFDTGAYCSSMASNYNLRLRPLEIMVDALEWRVIRNGDTFDGVTLPYTIKTATPNCIN